MTTSINEVEARKAEFENQNLVSSPTMAAPVDRSASANTLHVIPIYDVMFTDKHVVNQLETIMLLIENLVDSRDFEAASTAFTALLCNMKECSGLIFALGYLMIQRLPRLNNINSANNFFNSIFSQKKRNQSADIRIGWMIFESILFKLRRRDFTGALFALEDQLRNDRRDRDHIYNALSGLMQFRKFLDGNGHSFSSWMNHRSTHGSSLESNDDLVKAIDRMQKALVLEPDNETYAYYLTLMTLESGNESGALQLADHFSKSHLESSLGFLTRAKLLRKLNRPELKTHEIAAWQLVLELDPINDEAYFALLQYYREKQVSILLMLKIVMTRMDILLTASESLAMWKFFAALLVARKRAIEANERIALGTPQMDKEFLTGLYAWRQRYWSFEAWSLQQDLNTATRSIVVFCCMLIYGRTSYTLNAVASMAETSTNDMFFHMNPFGGGDLLKQHLDLITRYKQLKQGSRQMNNLRKSTKTATRQENIASIVPQSASLPPEQLFSAMPIDHPIPDSDFQASVPIGSTRSKKRRREFTQDDLLLGSDAQEPPQKQKFEFL